MRVAGRICVDRVPIIVIMGTWLQNPEHAPCMYTSECSSYISSGLASVKLCAGHVMHGPRDAKQSIT